MKRASIIVRYSNRSPRRERNLKIVVSQASKIKDCEVLVSVMEHDTLLSGGFTKKFVPDAFELCRASNIGASSSSANVFIIQDADILVETASYHGLIDAISSGCESAVVGEQCTDLSEHNVPPFQQSDRIDALVGEFRNTRPSRKGLGIFAISREAYVRIGGYCELFKVYGWDDCYMALKMKKATKFTDLSRPVVHLAHEVNYQSQFQPTNAETYYQLLYANDSEFQTLLDRDRVDLLGKYSGIARLEEAS
jgi:hypothetical protein